MVKRIKIEDLTVHHIELARTGSSMSGGEVCCLEIIRHLSRKGIKNIVYTSANGVKDYRAFLRGEDNIDFIEIDSSDKKIYPGGLGTIFTYWKRAKASRRKVIKFNNKKTNIIISNSDFWPTVIYARWLKIKNPTSIWLAYNHMLAPKLFKGFRYHYVSGQYKLPSLSEFHYWLNQRVYFIWTKLADALVITNTSYLPLFKKYKENIIYVRYASDVENFIKLLPQIELKNKKYDSIFIGRFHDQKGIFEIADIVKTIVKTKPDFKCVMVGDDKCIIGEKFKRKIRENGIEKNFEFLGSRVGLEKYQMLNNSKVFFFPSYYESFGIVYLESISLGVPVVEYDLPIFQDHQGGVIKIPFLNNNKFAEEVITLTEDKKIYVDLSRSAKEYSKQFSWGHSADNMIKSILEMLNA